MIEETIIVLHPQQMTDAQLEAAYNLVGDGGEVDTASLRRYFRMAQSVGLLECGSELACVAAIKVVRPDYIRQISKKSGYSLENEGCVGEFGYVVTAKQFRQRGFAKRVASELLSRFGGRLYATTRDDNEGIHRILHENGFQRVGTKWKSTEHPSASIILWLRVSSCI